MSSSDAAIRSILRASNHFDALKLPRPTADLMEQPLWDVKDDQISRVYRKLSLCCHPDKSTHADAPRAWEVLKQAKKCLLNPLERDDYMISFIREQKTNWEGNWGSVDSAVTAKERTATMRDAAKNEQGESVADAMRERHEKAVAVARRKERLQAAQSRAEARRAAPDRDADGDDDSDDEEEQRSRPVPAGGGGGASGGRGAGAARKRPKFL